MALLDLRFFSNVLGKHTNVWAIVPQTPGPHPVLYLLHGLSDDHTIWTRRSRIEVYANALPLIVVMPDGGRSFYTRPERGPDYAKFIGDELPTTIEAMLHARTGNTRARCIGGLSMGGYGAMRVGLEYAEKFASIHSHSGALNVINRIDPKLEVGSFAELFGHSPAGTEHDLLFLAKRAKRRGVLPKIRIDCGTEDFLLNENRTAHAGLTKLGVPHDYQEFPGGHTWDYWDLHVQEALTFHCKALRIKQP